MSQVPVLPGSLVVEVDDDPGGDVFGTDGGEAGGLVQRGRRWTAWPSTGPTRGCSWSTMPPGEVTFGDGIHGARVPRRVPQRPRRALPGGRRCARAGSTPRRSPRPSPRCRSSTRVTNPFPASGGVDAEADAAAIRRGPDELRSRGRAVAPADYAAAGPPGARAPRSPEPTASPGCTRTSPGPPSPAWSACSWCGPTAPTGRRYPTEADLQAVTAFLTRSVAPAGVEVVAAAAPLPAGRRWRRGWSSTPTRPRPTSSARPGTPCDRYLHPLQRRRGRDGLAVRRGPPPRRAGAAAARGRRGAGRAAAQRRRSTGVRQPPCTDRPIAAHALLWPDGHELLPVEQRGAP